MPSFELLSHERTEDGHEFELALSAEPVMQALEARIRALAPRAEVPGFRPGKAPLEAVRRRYFAPLQNELLQGFALDCARQLFSEHGIQPVARPEITLLDQAEPDAGPAQPLRVGLKVETLPVIEPLDLAGVQLRRYRVTDTPTGSELEHAADQLLRKQLFDVLDARHPFPVPLRALRAETSQLMKGFRQEVGETPDKATRRMLEQIARRRLRLAILLTELGRQLQIQVTREELSSLVQAQASRSPEYSAALEQYYLAQPAALAELRAPVFEARVVAELLARCNLETVPISSKDFSALLATAEPEAG